MRRLQGVARGEIRGERACVMPELCDVCGVELRAGRFRLNDLAYCPACWDSRKGAPRFAWKLVTDEAADNREG